MGLLVSATAQKKILIKGTGIELPSVYVRLEYAARANGIVLEIAATTYASKQAYKEEQGAIFTDVQQGIFSVELQEGEQQNLDSAELYSKLAFEQLGYLVENE
jgi:hypothetical protein